MLRYFLDFCEKYGFSETQKSSSAHFLQKLNYYLTRDKREEVDFIVTDTSGKPSQAIQVCLNLGDERTLEREISPLISVAQFFDIDNLSIVTTEEEHTITREGFTIRIIPAWKYLLEEG